MNANDYPNPTWSAEALWEVVADHQDTISELEGIVQNLHTKGYIMDKRRNAWKALAKHYRQDLQVVLKALADAERKLVEVDYDQDEITQVYERI